jgi:hypothetical protein
MSDTNHSKAQQTTPQSESYSPTTENTQSDSTFNIAPYSLPVGTAPASFSKSCIVCRGEIMEKDQFISCPFCGEAAHSKHFLEWTKIHASCPNCKRSIKAEWWIH